MVNVAGLEVPPPGAGLKIVTTAVPGTAISDAEIEPRTSLLLTYVVVRLEPFHRTVDPFTNPDPYIVSVKPFPPAIAELGDREAIEGSGLIRPASTQNQ